MSGGSAVLLAIDQGSSSSRCVVFDGKLRALATGSRPLATSFPAAGRVEHDPAQIVCGVLGAMRDAMGEAEVSWTDVAGIGLAAQTETFVVWDRATGQAVYPAISWRDGRAAGLCAQLRDAGCQPDIQASTGLPLEPAFSASKVAWLLDEIPGARRRAAAGQLLFGDVNSWLTWHLSGGAAHITEPSMAARTMLFGLAAGGWSAAMLELFGVPEQILPAIVPTVGRLATTDAGVCGGQAVISASIGDQPGALFGQRCWQEGMAKLTLGTGAFLWCHAGNAPPSRLPPGTVSSCAWQLPGETAYALEGFVPNAGGVTSWLRQIGALAPGAWPSIRAGALRDPAAGPWCVPALFGLGTPHWGAGPRADIFGLTAASTAADLAEAALLGVVHQIVDAIEAVRSGLRGPLEVVRVDGGLAANDSVLRAIADLAGVALERPAVTEATALGAGALAGLGTGQWDRAALGALPSGPRTAISPTLPADLRTVARDGWRSALAASIARGQAAGHPTGLEAS
ncbi:MAG TPA: FGGY family carbohydrate kinase [Streptosporangiaceae bacterium]|nr:FGGY family carbohydrate kinase [Streptosporangiaceae bacterium]